jgi:hypothetical protein
MNYYPTSFVPMTTVMMEPASTPEAPAFSRLELSAYEEVGQAVLSGTVAHVVVVTEGEVTLRFAEHDHHLGSDAALHIPGDTAYSIWNHTPWRSKLLRAELEPREFACPSKSMDSSSLVHVDRIVHGQTREPTSRFSRPHSRTKPVLLQRNS